MHFLWKHFVWCQFSVLKTKYSIKDPDQTKNNIFQLLSVMISKNFLGKYSKGGLATFIAIFMGFAPQATSNPKWCSVLFFNGTMESHQHWSWCSNVIEGNVCRFFYQRIIEMKYTYTGQQYRRIVLYSAKQQRLQYAFSVLFVNSENMSREIGFKFTEVECPTVDDSITIDRLTPVNTYSWNTFLRF